MASQPLMAFALVGLGLRQLSVGPRSVTMVKRIIRGVSAGAAEEGANAALASESAALAEHELRQRLLAIFPDAFRLGDGVS
jgi:phosphotransferase system enzyme I (PtsI)